MSTLAELEAAKVTLANADRRVKEATVSYNAAFALLQTRRIEAEIARAAFELVAQNLAVDPT